MWLRFDCCCCCFVSFCCRIFSSSCWLFCRTRTMPAAVVSTRTYLGHSTSRQRIGTNSLGSDCRSSLSGRRVRTEAQRRTWRTGSWWTWRAWGTGPSWRRTWAVMETWRSLPGTWWTRPWVLLSRHVWKCHWFEWTFRHCCVDSYWQCFCSKSSGK